MMPMSWVYIGSIWEPIQLFSFWNIMTWLWFLNFGCWFLIEWFWWFLTNSLLIYIFEYIWFIFNFILTMVELFIFILTSLFHCSDWTFVYWLQLWILRLLLVCNICDRASVACPLVRFFATVHNLCVFCVRWFTLLACFVVLKVVEVMWLVMSDLFTPCMLKFMIFDGNWGLKHSNSLAWYWMNHDTSFCMCAFLSIPYCSTVFSLMLWVNPYWCCCLAMLTCVYVNEYIYLNLVLHSPGCTVLLASSYCWPYVFCIDVVSLSCFVVPLNWNEMMHLYWAWAYLGWPRAHFYLHCVEPLDLTFGFVSKIEFVQIDFVYMYGLMACIVIHCMS